MRREIIELLFGPRYLPAEAVIKLLVLYPLFGLGVQIFLQQMLLQRRTWTVGAVFCLALMVQVFGCVLLIPRYGMVGLAAVVVITQGGLCLALFWLAGIPAVLSVRRIRLVALLGAGAAMAGVLWAGAGYVNPWVLAGLGVAIYAAALGKLRVLSSEEFGHLRRLLREGWKIFVPAKPTVPA